MSSSAALSSHQLVNMTFDRLELPPAADFHVHLRDGAMMELVTPMIREAGVDTAYIMPNLQPPITTVQAALAYHARLKAIDPDVNFLMTLFLHPSITPSTIAQAARTGVIAGVKSYPSGVTTNSDDGVLDYEQYYPVFEAMAKHDLVLNLHGEVPSTPSAGLVTDADPDAAEAVTVFNAESKFLPTLRKLHAVFPGLRIVLEHCTTREALDTVRACGPTVAGTITAHHLTLGPDNWAGNSFYYCKPVAKGAADRVALLRAAASGDPKFFFGSDSAPHPASAKRGDEHGHVGGSAGIFTQPYATALVLAAFEEGFNTKKLTAQVTKDAIQGFLCGFGRAFYKVDVPIEQRRSIIFEKRGEVIPDSFTNDDKSIEVVPFGRGTSVYSVRWQY